MVEENEQRESRRKAELDALRAEIRKGIESGPGIPAEQIFEWLERKYGRE
jgi:antitoxin ParD1/3/4